MVMMQPAWSRPVLVLGGAAMLCVSALVGCEAEEPIAPEQTELSPEALLVRGSLDLRGTRPTTSELQALRAAPAELDIMLDALVDDPRFGDRIRSIFAPAVRTRQDDFRFSAFDYGIDDDDDPAMQRAMAEEVLNIMHHVALMDEPFSNIFEADYTVIDPIMLQVWPLQEAEEQADNLPTGTIKARYTDGRPSAGVLATNAFFWRHTSTIENANRGRSNAISRAFLCEDYLDRPIDFPTDVDLTDSEGIRDAIRTNPGCQACHATLDPFASHLWGFMQLSDDAVSWSSYKPEAELMWSNQTEAVPAFFGTPTSGTLRDLALRISSDERFVACTVERMYEAFIGRPVTLDDEGQLVAHRETFLASGLSLKSLARALLRDPAYRGKRELSSYGAYPEPATAKLASPEQLSSSLFDLSGYALTVDGRNAIDVDKGLRALAGGSERGPSRTPSLGHALVHRRLAEGAARFLVEGTGSDSRIGKTLGATDLDQPPSGAALVALILETRQQSVTTSSAEVAELQALWTAADENQGASEAWAAVLTALLADPALAVY